MAWAMFHRRFPYTPAKNRRVCIVYLPGLRQVPREAHDKAIALGYAETHPTPARPKEDS